ncbi:MAG: PKD domain-containing protein [Flavobacteriales bacterium]|nr:PKD domain-containing protein [Flavobacteriales bacterium]MBK7941080.1 PKD domain-containing protein [Flavobacteriales bacterium]MBK9701108.1 PKD domain-containing protein [Flavobacteriales bacterium]
MAQRYATLRSLLFTSLSTLLAGPLAAQVLVDNFNRANNTTVGGGWTETESSGTSSCQVSSNELLMGGTTSGRDFVAQTTPGTYNTTLTNNTCNMTWAFNMRQSRTAPSGFDAGNYGVAVVIAGTNADFTLGDGYAVVLGNTGTPDPLRLVRYTGGLDANSNLTTIITGPNVTNNYLDVRVVYNPLTDGWQLFYTDNGAAGPFGDPLVAATSGGSTVDATYTGVSAPNIGCLWNHATSGTDNARFDNFYVPSACTTTTVQFTGSSASVSETGVSTTLTVSITNPDAINATTADVVLTAGTASRIGNYTTQTVTFPAGSSANQTVTVTLTDNGACDGDEVFTFQLQNVAGGNSATAGSPSSFNLTLTDNELVTNQLIARQAFDGLGSDTWAISAGAGNISAATGGTDVPVNQRILSGTQSWQVNNGNVTLDLGTVNVSAYSNVVIRARMSSLSVGGGGNGADAGDNVQFFVDLNSGGFPGTADITVAGNGNAHWGYSTGTGTASTTAGTPVSLAPAGGGARTTDGYTFIQINIPGGTNTVAFRAIALNNSANEVWALEDVEVRGDLCRPIYYTRANGDQTTATWSTTRTGTATAVTFDLNATGVVQNGHTVTATGATWTVYDLDVEAGGSVVMGTTNLEHYGTALTNNNSFTIGTGAVTFRNPGAVTMSGSGTYDLYDVTANNADVTLTSSLLRIRRTLDMTNGGTFNANNIGNPARVLELHSDATGTGRIGPMSAGPSFTGQVDMERYVPGGVTNWRLISAPTNNNQLSSLEDDFITAGYPGSHFPLFDDPPGSNILWPSIRTYDETNGGAALIDGLIGATGDNMVMAMGQGFAAWSGTGLVTTSPFTIDLRSGVRNALTPLNLPVTYTNTGNALVDGWNLVGNPVPSPIDFSLLALTNVDNFYYVFDPVSGNNAAWDEGLGVSIPGGSLNGNIQSFQGFWVKANTAAPVVTVEETDKVLDLNGGGLFGGSQQGAAPMFRLELSNAMNAFFDETLVHFGTGGPTSGDTHDLVKFTFSHPEAPQVMTRTSDGQDMTLNAWGPLTGATSIEVPIDVGVTGSYTLRVHDALGIMGQTCLVLEDLQTGQSTALTEGATYTFTADANDPVLPARFVVHASAPVQHTATDVTCQGAANGNASALGAGLGPWDYTWATDGGTVLLSQTQVNGAGQIAQLPAGDYLVTVSSQAGCGDLTHAFRIDEPALLDVALTATGTACAATTDGAVDLTVMGGTGPYTFAWDNGATSEDIANVAAGTYTVTVTDANGCTTAPLQATVATGNGPNAAFLPSTTSTFTGEPVEFFNLSTWGAQVNWDFGDGTGSTDTEPTHTYTVPGVYTVTLTVTLDGCTAVSTQEVVVDVNTGIAPVADDLARVWLDDQHVVVDLQQQRADEVVITVLDGAGRVVAERRARMSSTRERIPVDHVAGGVILVRLLTADQGRTYKLPLAR